MALWREYEPDFIAEIESDKNTPHYLVVEVKGLEDPASDLKKAAAENWCEVLTGSSDSRLKGRWDYLYVTEPRYASDQINELLGETS